MARTSPGLTIGELSERTGLAVSAIRFYETKGLVGPLRNAGGHRRYDRSDIRKLSFVMIAQDLGFALSHIADVMADLPDGRAPNRADWGKISRNFRVDIDERIARLTRLRDLLDGCIGCGCLSMRRCALYNPRDRAKDLGKGPRYLLGDRPEPPKSAKITSE